MRCVLARRAERQPIRGYAVGAEQPDNPAHDQPATNCLGVSGNGHSPKVELRASRPMTVSSLRTRTVLPSVIMTGQATVGRRVVGATSPAALSPGLPDAGSTLQRAGCWNRLPATSGWFPTTRNSYARAIRS